MLFNGGGGRELLTCPYPLKVQACPPRDQRPALLSGVSGREDAILCVCVGGGGGRRIINIPISTTRPKTGSLVWGLRAGGCYSV